MGARAVTEDMRAARTPEDVDVTAAARAPVEDPTLGIPVAVDRSGEPPHRIVAIGDSLTHGFQSGAVGNTALSYPAIVAWELGWFDRFRFPLYRGTGGLPINLEWIVRRLEERFGSDIDLTELVMAAIRVNGLLDEIEDWWERGEGAKAPIPPVPLHALAVYGWDLRDALELTAEHLRRRIRRPKDEFIPWRQGVVDANARAALVVLGAAYDPPPDRPTSVVDPEPPEGRALTLLEAAAHLGADGPEGVPGIETLVVALGANNALEAVTRLQVCWSTDGYDDLERKDAFTVWRPEHFEAELDAVFAKVERIDARHVIWCTVPHVTIAPVARGVGAKERPDSRYFPYYTRPWISDRDFNPRRDPCITGAEARAVDSAIDQYNAAIVERVRRARTAGRDHRVLDTAGVMDRLAYRRYRETPAAQPEWWSPYPLPAELMALDPVPDSRFFRSGPEGRTQGGLFSLDGVHPTTVGYGILAQEVLDVMAGAGVRIAGTPPGVGHRVDFARLVRLDTLISDPPASIAADLRLIGWLDQHVGWLPAMLKEGRRRAMSWPLPVASREG